MNVQAFYFVALFPFACAQTTGGWRDPSPHRAHELRAFASPAAPNLSGRWEIDADFDDASLSGGGFDCVFKQEGDRLTGSCQDIPLTGEVKEASVKWQIRAGQTPDVITYMGIVNESGTRINGRFSLAGKGGRFTASKQ